MSIAMTCAAARVAEAAQAHLKGRSDSLSHSFLWKAQIGCSDVAIRYLSSLTSPVETLPKVRSTLTSYKECLCLIISYWLSLYCTGCEKRDECRCTCSGPHLGQVSIQLHVL